MGSGISTSKPLGNNGSGVSMSTPFGNNGSGVSMQHPLGGSNSFANQGAYWGQWLSPATMLLGSQTHEVNNPFTGVNPAYGVNASSHRRDQMVQGKQQANQAGLIGQQAGNALGGGSQGGGIGAHYSNLGYNNALAQFAQIASQQNAQGQGQAMQGIGSLLALLPLLL